MLPSLKTKTMSTSPAVTRNAPSQSTRLCGVHDAHQSRSSRKGYRSADRQGSVGGCVCGWMPSSTEEWCGTLPRETREDSQLVKPAGRAQTHLSFSVDGLSASNESIPPRKVAALRPAMNQNVERHVFLGSNTVSAVPPHSLHKQQKTHSVSCVSTPPIALPIAAPTGAPAAKVANATERVLLGGNECARMPSCGRKPRQRNLGSRAGSTGTQHAPMRGWQRRNRGPAGREARRL